MAEGSSLKISLCNVLSWALSLQAKPLFRHGEIVLNVFLASRRALPSEGRLMVCNLGVRVALNDVGPHGRVGICPPLDTAT